MITTDTRLDNTTANYRCGIKCISWSAIITGALIGLGLTFLLQLFGTAIGLTAFDTTAGADSIAMGGYIGTMISIVIAMFIAGWVSGYLAKATCFNEYMGILYGFTTWCLVLLLTAWLSLHITQIIAYHAHAKSSHSASNMLSSVASVPTGGADDSSASNTGANRTAASGENSNAASGANGNAASGASSDSVTPAQADKASDLGKALLGIFILFLSGALASCFGGYFGLKSRCGERDIDRDRDRPTVV